MNDVTIYALEDPDSGGARYIGQTCNGLDMRLYQHLTMCEGIPAKRAWLDELAARHTAPVIKSLAVVNESDGRAAEAAQIKAHLARGCRLTNGTHNPAEPRSRHVSVTPLEKSVLVRLDPQLYERIAQVADADDRKVAAVVRRMIEYAVPHFEERVTRDEAHHE